MAKRKSIKTYEATMSRKKVRVTVPEDPDPADALVDAIKDNLSPAAVATIIAYLQPAQVKDKGDGMGQAVNREVRWFSEKLVEAVGGNSALAQLMDEVGL